MHLTSTHRDPYASAQGSTSSSPSTSAPSTSKLQPSASTSSSLLSRFLRRKKHSSDSPTLPDASSRRSSIDSQTTFVSTTPILKSTPFDYGRPPATSCSDDQCSNVVTVPSLPCHPAPSAASTKPKALHKIVDNEPRRAALLASSVLR